MLVLMSMMTMMMMTTDHLSAESSFMMLEGDPASFRAHSPALPAVANVSTHGWM